MINTESKKSEKSENQLFSDIVMLRP